MKYDHFTFNKAPELPGIYKLVYTGDGRIYIGATRNLRKRFKEHSKCWYSQQWKLNLCKEFSEHESTSLSEVYKQLAKLFQYEVLELFDKDVLPALINNAEAKYLSLHSPDFNHKQMNGRYFVGYKD